MESGSKNRAYLSLGTNLGDRKANLETILDLLAQQVDISRVSSIYQTEPWGYSDQPFFLNQVAEINTTLRPVELLDFLKGIERQLGRKPTTRYGPRVADIDILFYGDEIIETDRLIVPHPRFRERAFVVVPLAEIAPDLLIPGSEETIKELLAGMDTTGVEVFQDLDG
jgi:2-amino-4-hydroxy-6-hydroxymethyldihydropteridine diphosphokinase